MTKEIWMVAYKSVAMNYENWIWIGSFLLPEDAGEFIRLREERGFRPDLLVWCWETE